MAELTKMVLQPMDCKINQLKDGRMQYVEKWKGPWTGMYDWPSTLKCMNTVLMVGLARPNFPSSSWDTQYAVYEPRFNKEWVIEGIDINEYGHHGWLTLTYLDGDPMFEPGGTGGDSREYPDDALSSDANVIDGSTITWTCDWESDNRNVLQYSERPQDVTKWVNFPFGGNNEDDKWKYYSDKRNTVFELRDERDQKIAGWLKAGIKPLFHYPILVNTFEFTSKAPNLAGINIGVDIDKIIQNMPNGCPFTELWPQWEWVCMDDSVEHTSTTNAKVIDRTTHQVKDIKTLKFRRSIKYRGAKKWIPELYGQNAWQPVVYEENNGGAA